VADPASEILRQSSQKESIPHLRQAGFYISLLSGKNKLGRLWEPLPVAKSNDRGWKPLLQNNYLMRD